MWNDDEQLESETRTLINDTGPYLVYRVVRTTLDRCYNPEYDEDAECLCGHAYYRHFDTYENMYPIGCKYCGCRTFVPATTQILKEF